jgi:hypothetical protein
MDLNFFENNIFCQNFNINLNQIVWKILKDFFEDFSKIFQEYFPKNNHKRSQKAGGHGLCYPSCTCGCNSLT